MDIPLIEQAKIQAQVLVPLVKALQAELGEGRANAIVRKALGEHYRKLGEKQWRASDVGDAFDVNVTGCRYAQFYTAIGAPELGFLLVCSADAPMAEGAGMQLTRTQTIMQGASHCDFRYRLAK